jgi:8-oxo-dGTP diphosphatase
MTREYPAHPFVGVGALVWRDERVLLIRRRNPPRAGQWSLPGGGQEVGETIAEAAAREVAEETGLLIAVEEVVEVIDLIERDTGGRVQYHYVLVDVNARWTGGDPAAGDDAVDTAWATLDELGDFGLWSETERVIRRGYQQRRREDHA